MARFEVCELHSHSYTVEDSQHEKFNMPKKAVSLYMRYEAAVEVCRLLNKEWAAFLANPN